MEISPLFTLFFSQCSTHEISLSTAFLHPPQIGFFALSFQIAGWSFEERIKANKKAEKRQKRQKKDANLLLEVRAKVGNVGVGDVELAGLKHLWVLKLRERK